MRMSPMRHAINVITEREYCYSPLLSFWGNLTFESVISGNDRRTLSRPACAIGLSPLFDKRGIELLVMAKGEGKIWCPMGTKMAGQSVKSSTCY
jgi:hypothetical protein